MLTTSTHLFFSLGLFLFSLCFNPLLHIWLFEPHGRSIYIYIVLVASLLSIYPVEKIKEKIFALLGRSEEQLEVMESRQLTALVVDDDTVVRMVHQKMLNRVGVKNQVVENGKEAIDIHKRGQSFDLILMDLDMPIMNGIEATKKLRSMGIHSMIAGVSARSVEAHKEEYMEAGLDDYLEKPLTTAKLSSIINKINIL